MAADTSKVILGSGKLYIAALEDGAIPENLVSDANCVGDIKGGAELSYTPEIQEVKNDFGETRKAFITSEAVKLKTGIMTWDLPVMEKFTLGGTYNSTTKKLTIGGKSAITQYALAFVHEADGFDVTVTMKGYNASGWTFKFDPENAATTEVEFTATKGNDKTLVTIAEEAKDAA